MIENRARDYWVLATAIRRARTEEDRRLYIEGGLGLTIELCTDPLIKPRLIALATQKAA